MLELSDGAIAHFYERMSMTSDGESPVKHCRDSRWMIDSDFCLVNPRATGLNGKLGTFISASKILPIIRANAIHLTPFTSCERGICYNITSVLTIAEQVVDRRLQDLGFPAEDQLRAFVTAAHVLNKTVGFDLEPHVSQFGATVIMNPHLFRWIKLEREDRDRLDGDLTQDQMLSEGEQRRLVGEIRAIVADMLKEHRIADVEPSSADDPGVVAIKRSVASLITRALIEEGYWTVLSHAWAGIGIPSFLEYNHDGNYPRFRYLTRDGRDQADQAYGVLTPYAFYHNIPAGRAPGAKPAPNEDSFEFYSSIFHKWRDQFDFDFVRHDYVDHVFDSIVDDDPSYPISDRPTPFVLRHCIERSRTPEKPYIGHLAERYGVDLEQYAGVGYDLLMGPEISQYVTTKSLTRSFKLSDQIEKYNSGHDVKVSFVYAIDTHDAGGPAMWGDCLTRVLGAGGIQLRLFLARFGSCGLARRPKYEVMGDQDLSYNLNRATIREENLVWVGDQRHNVVYHAIEDVYDSLRGLLASARLIYREILPEHAWWLMGTDDQWLVAMVALEGGSDAPVHISGIDLRGWVGEGLRYLQRYEFAGRPPEELECSDCQIPPVTLPYRGFALFRIW
jgi:hypothetical protein